MVRKFFFRSLCLIGLNLLLFFGWLVCSAWLVSARHFRNSDTESSLLPMPSGQAVDLVFLGSSHGRNFSRFSNHGRVERLLGKTVVNLSRGNGAGVVPMKAYLEAFYDQGNRCQELVWFIDPWVFYSENWNEKYADYDCEPFSFTFATRLIGNGASASAVYRYLRSKFSAEWLTASPRCDARCDRRVPQRDETAVHRRIENLYHAGLEKATFERYAAVVEQVVELAQRHDARVTFMLSPTLLGDEPGRGRLMALLRDLQTKYGANFHDLTVAVQSPELFEDHDHLNTAGVERFVLEYLNPLLDRERSGAPHDPVASRPGAAAVQ